MRRFRVLGDVPEGFRDTYRAQLNDQAFRDPPNEPGKQEIEGWVQVHNMLDNQFDSFDKWLYDPYALFALRTDKKVLPAALLRAHVEKEALAWCAERGVERCPSTVKSEIKERIEDDWLRRTLPRVKVTEVLWHMEQGFVLIHSLSEGTIDRIKRRFFQTFGLRLVPWSPLDWLDSATTVETLLASAPSVLHEER